AVDGGFARDVEQVRFLRVAGGLARVHLDVQDRIGVMCVVAHDGQRADGLAGRGPAREVVQAADEGTPAGHDAAFVQTEILHALNVKAGAVPDNRVRLVQIRRRAFRYDPVAPGHVEGVKTVEIS